MMNDTVLIYIVITGLKMTLEMCMENFSINPYNIDIWQLKQNKNSTDLMNLMIPLVPATASNGSPVSGWYDQAQV